MYGWSKLYCEKLLENWSKENNIILQILRVGHIYGKGEETYKKVIPVTIEKLKNEMNPQIFGTGYEKRSFLHVDDVSNLIIKSISLEKYEGVINLCSSNSYNIKNIVEMLIEISNKKVQIDYIETENRSIDFEFDTSKMNKLLGVEKINIKDGLSDEYFE
jgi:nucleoside-diphosphate-sugar epimerase